MLASVFDAIIMGIQSNRSIESPFVQRYNSLVRIAYNFTFKMSNVANSFTVSASENFEQKHTFNY